MDEVTRILSTTEGAVALWTSLISGAVAGVGLGTIHHTVTHPIRRAILTALVVLWLGVLYNVSLMAAVAVAGNPVPAFVYALAVLWGVFSAGVLVGCLVMFKLRT